MPRAWRVGRITPLAELLSSPRLTATAVRLAIQIVLVVALWRGLYDSTGTSAGLNESQAVSYAVLAVLATRIRGLDRQAARDTVMQHINQGTIVYWFLRPLPPARYYAWRATGDQLYGYVWFVAGYLICWPAGVLTAPPSTAAGALTATSLVLGQIVLHYVTLLIDLVCFWTLRNHAAQTFFLFMQNLLSGVYAPLWYFPEWFRVASNFLPFQSTLNTPLSIHIGRIPATETAPHLAAQFLWIVLLALLTRWLWGRAAARVVAQGG
ncbi:ABC-2 family transporter protein [Streptomyces sp. PTY087I2]|uniref:ABC transporter permease n=1 Tax=Streptomyces sp. PTY087I2 TaxID=1819298 RepID=UPI00080B0515|nr:ABC-2 family transporter protein [Streptomyces sp. PTY087I2]